MKMQKSKLSFLGEDGSGFEVDITPIKNNRMTAKVSLVNKELIKNTDNIDDVPPLHMAIGLDVIMKMQGNPEIFDMHFVDFDIMTIDREEFENGQSQAPFVFGAGGDA
jgi:hypothetical protein